MGGASSSSSSSASLNNTPGKRFDPNSIEPRSSSLFGKVKKVDLEKQGLPFMGEEAQGLFLDGLDEFVPLGPNSESPGYQTATVLGEKIYVIGQSSDGATSLIYVRIFNKSTRKWLVPSVVGTKPYHSKGHSAVLLNKDRILILKWDSSLDECIWFLEVDTPFVKEKKKILDTEVVAWSKGVRDGLMPIVISGPSGVGKGTLISKLMKEFPSTFGFSVSHTTRSPREKEKDGVHYHFTERSVMEKDIQNGKFLESASVHGNLYGTSIEAVEAVTDVGKRCILDIDVQGARSVNASSLEALFIFICPPSFEELEKRLRARGTESEEQIQKRLRNAREELEQGKSSGIFEHQLVNDNLEKCYEKLKNILGLHDAAGDLYQPFSRAARLPICRSVSVTTDQKALIHCGTDELGEGTDSLFVLDASSLKGGAPGRTRRLTIRAAVDPLIDDLNTIEQLENSEY